jgi:glycosyltransferase involved in cell wall biosynthesis
VPAAKLVLIGQTSRAGPSTYEQCLNDIKILGLADNVTVRTFEADVLSVEQIADVVVLCSEREPLGTVVLESMALAKPIVIANSGGLPEMIDDSVSGLHCLPGNVDSLYLQLKRLLIDRSLAESLGRTARKTAMERFSYSVHADSLLAIYDEVRAAPSTGLPYGRTIWDRKVGPHSA